MVGFALRSQGRRVTSFGLGASIVALATATASPAGAQCVSNPPAFGETTICSGTETQGVVIDVNQATILIPEAASLTAPTGTAALRVINSSSAILTNSAQLTLQGTILGDGAAAISVESGTGFAASHLNMTVEATGVVRGTTGVNIVINPAALTGSAPASVSLNNSGRVEGTAGPAISGLDINGSMRETFSLILNMETGYIGGIQANVSRIGNLGTIEGGAFSAISGQYISQIGNSGLITSNSADPTVLSPIGPTINNSGTISNTGAGIAIDGAQELTIRNYADAVISADGGTAIRAGRRLTLESSGTINGSLLGGSWDDRIILTGGQLNGSISLGDGDDYLVVDSGSGPGLVGNVTGTLDGGAGTDTIVVRLTHDQQFTASPALPTFEILQFDLANDANLDISGLVTADGYVVSGTGSVSASGSLSGNGQLINTSASTSLPGVFSFDNSGTITADAVPSGVYAVMVSGSVRNTGTITAIDGNGIFSGSYGELGFTNSGAISATGIGASVVGVSVQNSNSGEIRSTSTIALQGGGYKFTNDGIISGVTRGVSGSMSQFVNNGTISASAGIGFQPGFRTIIDNTVSGVISGTTASIGGSSTNVPQDVRIRNAGSLIGDVSRVRQLSYIDAGGSLTGDLLGLFFSDDLLITDLVQAAGRPFAGVSGTIDPGEGLDQLRFRVSEDGTSGPIDRRGFELLGFELSNNARLNYDAGAAAGSLVLLGQGSVELSGNITTNDMPAISFVGLTENQLLDIVSTLTTDLTVISRGVITYNQTTTSCCSVQVAVSGYSTRTSPTVIQNFENAGTMNINGISGGFTIPIAIAGVTSGANSGTINLDHAVGFSGVATVVNSGSIVEAASSSFNVGIEGAKTVTNSGIITVSGVAVGVTNTQVDRITITNSGRIESTGAQGIYTLTNAARVFNLVDGTIIGASGGKAVDLSGAAYLENAGSIIGDVNLGVQSGSFAAPGAYIGRGGTIQGDLTFGTGSDLLLVRDGVTGVSGTIDGGSGFGFDRFGTLLAASGSITIGGALPTNFEGYAVGTEDRSVIATITGPASGLDMGLTLIGDGTFINTLDLRGNAVKTAGYGLLVGFEPIAQAYVLNAALDNRANITNGVFGALRSFLNSGEITAPESDPDSAVRLFVPTNEAFTFRNSGTIAGISSSGQLGQASVVLETSSGVAGSTPSVNLENSGTISGLDSATRASQFTLLNDGTIRSDHFSGAAVYLKNEMADAETLTVVNTGQITGQALSSSALVISTLNPPSAETTTPATITITNSGSVSANIALPSFFPLSTIGAAVAVLTSAGDAVTVQNQTGGVIEARWGRSVALYVEGGAATIVNNGTITGGEGTIFPASPFEYAPFLGAQTSSTSGPRMVAVPLAGTLAGAIQTDAAHDSLRNNGTIIGSINLEAGDDLIENYGTIMGDVALGAGNDNFVQWVGGLMSGTVNGGDGIDTFTIDATGGGTIDDSQFIGFENFNQIGTGSLTYVANTIQLDNSNMTIGAGATLIASGPTTITGGNGVEQVYNSGTIAGGVSLGGGNDFVENSGAIGGAVDLGDGNDIFRFTGTQGFSGSVDGGAGTDRLEFAVGGTDATPFALGTSMFTNFETLDMQSGVASYGDTATFGAIMISGGRLIGLAGSRVTAGTITVASGATFGSAGTVVGNIAVAGTLSPGASPGTMTVIGDVSLANGSTSVFELTPTVSDQLVISGVLTIASGTTLTLTGTRPLTPGVTLDLISADGGINGTFSTINTSPTIQGFLKQSSNTLSLMGTFLTDSSWLPQVNATIDYLNTVLIAGEGSPALIAAVPSLLNADGTNNVAAFQQMSPEAYASASQLGTEQALTLVEAVRSQVLTRPTGDGLFTFGQTLTNHRRMDSDASSGVSGARFQSWGLLAGVGVAAEQGWVGAFVGYLDGHQTIAGLDARTETSGVMAGLQGAWQMGGFRLDALAAYSGGDADTRRTLLGTPLSGHFDLHSWVGDVRGSYALPLGSRWSLRPSIGLTGVRTTRGDTVESGNSPFALSVAQDSRTRWFLDGELLFEGGQADGDAFHPYAAIGVQRRLKGRNSAATASLISASTSYRLPGLEREETMATGRLGLGYDVTPRLGLFATLAGEIGDEIRHNGSVGLRLAM